LSHTSYPFCSGYFGDGVSQTIPPGWPCTMIFPISACQVAKITGISNQCLAMLYFQICHLFWVTFCLRSETKVNIHFVTYEYPTIHAWVVEKVSSLYWTASETLSIDQVAVFVWVCFWVLYCVFLYQYQSLSLSY
jgi:hypothetical protein